MAATVLRNSKGGVTTLAQLGELVLHRIAADGSVATEPTLFGSLSKETGALVHIVRRPG